MGMCSAWGATAEVRRTHNVFYRGLGHQALLQIKVHAQAGESIQSFQFTTGQTKKISDIRAARLYTSGSNPGFAPHASEHNRATELCSLKTVKEEFVFTKKIDLKEGVNH